MSSKISFEFDISVSADKKRRSKQKGSSGAFESSSHKCDIEGCELIGKYRAPKSPKNVDEFVSAIAAIIYIYYLIKL